MRAPMRIAICLALAISFCACGGNKNQPSDKPQSNGCIAVPNNYGGITATISGLPAYSGITQKGAAFASAPAGSSPGSVSVGAVDLKDGTQIIVTGPATLGATTAGLTTPAASSVSITLITIKQTCDPA